MGNAACAWPYGRPELSLCPLRAEMETDLAQGERVLCWKMLTNTWD